MRKLFAKTHLAFLKILLLCGLFTFLPLGLSATPRLMIEEGSNFTYDIIIVEDFPAKTPDVSDGDVIHVEILEVSIEENETFSKYKYNFSINRIFQYQKWEYTNYTLAAIGNFVLGFPSSEFFAHLRQNETVLNESGWTLETYEKNGEEYWITEKEQGNFIYKYHYNHIGILVEYAVQNTTTDLERWNKRIFDTIAGPSTIGILFPAIIGIYWQISDKKKKNNIAKARA